MEAIILTDKQKAVIEKQLEGKLNTFFMTNEERDIIDKVVEDAHALMVELDAFDELDTSLVAWYYNKYKEQFITQ